MLWFQGSKGLVLTSSSVLTFAINKQTSKPTALEEGTGDVTEEKLVIEGGISGDMPCGCMCFGTRGEENTT